MKKQRWIKFLGYVYDIRASERQRILKGIEETPGLSEGLKVMTEFVLPIFSFDSFRQITKSQDIKFGSYMRQSFRDKTKNWNDFISAYKKKPEDRSEDDRDLVAAICGIAKLCAKIGPRMQIGDVIDLANERWQDEEKGFPAESAIIDE